MHETDNLVIVNDVLFLYEMIVFNTHLEQKFLCLFCITKILSQQLVSEVIV